MQLSTEAFIAEVNDFDTDNKYSRVNEKVIALHKQYCSYSNRWNHLIPGSFLMDSQHDLICMKSDKGFEHRREKIIRKIDSQENKENNRTRSLQKEFKKMYGNDYPLYEHYLSPRKRLVRSKSPEKTFFTNSPYSQLLRAMVGHRREPLPGQMEEISPFESIVGKPHQQLVKSKSSIQTTTYEGNNNLSNYQSEYYQPQHQQRASPSYESSQQSRDEENENSEYSSSAKKSRRTREDRKKDKKASRDSPLNRLLTQVNQYSSNNQQNQLKMKSEPTRNVISSWTNQPIDKNFESCPYNSPSLSITDKRLSQQIDQQNYEQGIRNPSTFSSNTEKQSSPHEKRHYNSSPQDKRNSHQSPNNYYSADVQHYPSLGSAGKADFPDRDRTPSQVTVTESIEKGDQEWTLRSKEYDDPKKSSSSSLQKRSQEEKSVDQNRRSSKNIEPKSAKKLKDVETQYSDKDGSYLNKDKNSETSVSRKSHSRKLSETNPVEKSLRRDSHSQSRSKRESSKRDKSEEPNADGSQSSFKKASEREKSSSSKSHHSLSKKQRTPSIANTSEEYVSDNNRSMRGKEVEYQWEEQSDDQSAKKSRNSKSRSKRDSSKREKSEEPNHDGSHSSLKKVSNREKSSNSKSQHSLSKNARTPSMTSNTEEYISDNNRSVKGKHGESQSEEQSNDESAKKSRNSKSPSKSKTSNFHSPSQSREEFNASNEGSKRSSQSRLSKTIKNSDESAQKDQQSKSAKSKTQSQNQNAVDYETDSKNGSLFFNESFGIPSEVERNNKVPSKAKTTISDDRSDEDKLNKNRGYSSETPNYKKSSSSKNKSEYSEGANQMNTLIDQILKGGDKDDKISNRRSSQNNHNTSMSSQNKSLKDEKTPTFAQSEPEFNRKASNSNEEAERETRQAKSEVLDRNRESRNREKIQSVLAKGREKSKQRDSQETIQNSLHKAKRTDSPNNNISSSEISASAQSDNINRTPERPKRSKNKMQEYLSSNSKATVEEDHRKYKENKPKPKYDFKSDGLFSSDSPKPVESDFDSPGSNSAYSRNQQNSEKLYATAPKEEFVSSDSPDQKSQNEIASYKSSSSNNKIMESDLDSRQKDAPESGKEISSKNSVSPSRKKSKHREEVSSHSDRKSKRSGASALKTDTISSYDSFVREEEAIKKESEEEKLSQFSQQNNQDKNSSSSKSKSNRSKSKNKSQTEEEKIMSQKELFENKPKRVIETSEKEIQTQRSQEETEEKKGVYGEKLLWNDLKTAYKIQEQAVIKIQRHYRKAIKGTKPAPEQLDESITQEDLMTFIQTLKKQETSLNDFKLTLNTEEQKDEVISLMLAFISSYCSLGKTEYPVRK